MDARIWRTRPNMRRSVERRNRSSHTILLRPLPFAQSDRIVTISQKVPFLGSSPTVVGARLNDANLVRADLVRADLFFPNYSTTIRYLRPVDVLIREHKCAIDISPGERRLKLSYQGI